MIRKNAVFEKLIGVIEEYINKDEFPSKDKKGHSIVVNTRVPEFIDTILEVFRQEFNYVYLTKSDVMRHALYLGILGLYRRWYKVENKEASLYREVIKVINQKVAESELQKQLNDIILEKLEKVRKSSQEKYQEVIAEIKEILDRSSSSKVKEGIEEIIDKVLLRDALEIVQDGSKDEGIDEEGEEI